MKSVAIFVAIGAILDFWFGYFHTHSLLGAYVWIALGLGSTAFFVWLFHDKL
jgi:predicted ferric reductase